MRNTTLPFNVSLLDPSRKRLGNLKPVTSVDIYSGATDDFHSEGLFSIEIFGKLGTEERGLNFSYIDINTFVLHPVVYHELVSIKHLYKDIINAKQYAKWDDETSDFIRSNEEEGNTGYGFFMSKFKDIKFRRNRSDIRNLRIDLIEKYINNCLYRYVPVIPAGLRDIVVDAGGKIKQDEINDYYRKLLFVSRTVNVVSEDYDNEIHDRNRMILQTTVNEIYATFKRMLEGTDGLIQSKWGSRQIFNGTANVIGSMDWSVVDIEGPTAKNVNDTVVGLLQMIKAALPVTLHCLKQGIVGHVFDDNDAQLQLINPKTLQLEYVNLSSQERDKWITQTGLTKLIEGYREPTIAHKPVMVGKHYLALIYDDGEYFKVFNDLNEMPEDFSKDYVRPLTWCELFYTSCYVKFRTLYGLVTRYPILGLGSIYPSRCYTKTTVKGNIRKPLGLMWDKDEDLPVAPEMPIAGEELVHLLIPSTSTLKGLGGDGYLV